MPDEDARRALLQTMVADDPQRLRRRSIALGVGIDDADDVAQTALLRAWRSIESLETPEAGRMCSWLDAIARNVVVDLARQRARRPQTALDDEVPDERGVASEVEVRVILDAALAALHALPPALREPLLLVVVDGLTTAQVADRLGIAPATARQRISRARRAMSACRRSGMEPD
ncbi:RNA polymerase sigma factor [Streptomyces sp. AC495_CC817]|uniref:RNA polymerase sigma factor n=1 Tax=Streptomyces sp. AC495_CC817 TaxID=2823900 RepID=UPI001C27120D|nr:RNA polymerase sigma factor [Streptomyces sp. AC495_CC817]